MIRKIKGLISKLKYINRLIIDIDQKQQEIIKLESEVEESMSHILKHIDIIEDSIKRNVEIINQQEKKWEYIVNYTNLEYLNIPRDGTPKCLVVGFYGAINLGDELMLEKLYNDLEVVKDSVWIMMCDNEGFNVFRCPGKNIIHYPKTEYDYNLLADIFDCVIFGGGAIIDDVEYSQQGSFKYGLGKIFVELSSSFIAKDKGVYSFGLSTNKNIKNEEYKRKLINIIDNSTFFSVRDKYSRRVLEEICGHEVKEINDIVLGYKSYQVTQQKKEKFRIGIVWICYPEVKSILKDLLIYLKEKFDSEKTEIQLIQFYNYQECDYNFYKEICSEEDNVLISEMSYSYEEICNIICRCDLLISMRYHGALLGLLNHVKTLALLYEQHVHYYNKMTDLFEKFNVNQNLCTNIDELKKAVDNVDSIVQEEKEMDNSAYERAVDKIICDIKNNS